MTRYEHAGAEQLRRLLDAVMAVGSDLSLPAILQRIIETATELVGATYGALGVLDVSGSRLTEFITVGIDDGAASLIGNQPEGHGILGLLIVDPQPIRLPDLTKHPDSYGFPPNHPPMTSFLGVPILLHDTVFGNLYLTDKAGEAGDVESGGDGGSAEFTDVDVELAVGLAAAAAMAIESARLHQQLQDASLLEERERIARDLHDDVIQRVFAAGLALQSMAQISTQPVVAERLVQVVDDLDHTIRRVRSTIFQLNQRLSQRSSVRADIVATCHEAASSLGFEPRCQIRGPIDSSTSAGISTHLVLSLREALSNVARHAGASMANVTVAVDGENVTLTVEDDGCGVAVDRTRGNGLRNLADRAAAVGGTFWVGPGDTAGTVLRWAAPLR